MDKLVYRYFEHYRDLKGGSGKVKNIENFFGISRETMKIDLKKKDIGQKIKLFRKDMSRAFEKFKEEIEQEYKDTGPGEHKIVYVGKKYRKVQALG